jgi:DNA primase catalytic subunit
LNAIQALSQLSYGPTLPRHFFCVAAYYESPQGSATEKMRGAPK